MSLSPQKYQVREYTNTKLQCHTSFGALDYSKWGNLVQPWEYQNNSSKFIHAETLCIIDSRRSSLCQVHQSSRYCKIHISRKRETEQSSSNCCVTHHHHRLSIKSTENQPVLRERQEEDDTIGSLIIPSMATWKPPSYIHTYRKIGI